MLRRLSPPAVLLLATLAFFAAPSTPVTASDCGENDGVLCSETETCRSFWIFKWKCSITSRGYWPGL